MTIKLLKPKVTINDKDFDQKVASTNKKINDIDTNGMESSAEKFVQAMELHNAHNNAQKLALAQRTAKLLDTTNNLEGQTETAVNMLKALFEAGHISYNATTGQILMQLGGEGAETDTDIPSL